MSVRNKELCDSCQKEKIEPGNEGVYLGDYRGNQTDKIHVCENCYRSKEQEYLKNYAFIYTYEQAFKKWDTGYLKADEMKCYADKKDENRKILKQKDCSHCQPWKSNKKVLVEKIKARLNSSEYLAMPDLLTTNDYCPDFIKSEEKNCIVALKDWNFGKMLDDEEQKPIIFSHELEPKDWKEISNLVEKRNKERQQIYEQKRKSIEDKLNSQSNLYYFWGMTSKEHRASVWVKSKGMRGYTTFSGRLNNRGYGLYIAENHPILDNFSFEVGFYYIDTNKPIERNSPRYWSDGGESNPSNFERYVELGDNITITPYDEINSLVRIFQDQKIEQITLTNEENLLIEYESGNSNTASSQQIDNSSELNTVRNYFRKNNKRKLSWRDLDALLSTNSIQWPSSSGENNLEKIAIGIGVVLVVIGLCLLVKRSRRVKKH